MRLRWFFSFWDTAGSTRLTIGRLLVKVGDLVRHFMYSNYMPPAVVLKIRNVHRGLGEQILVLDDKGDVYWDRMSEYEVISESR